VFVAAIAVAYAIAGDRQLIISPAKRSESYQIFIDFQRDMFKSFKSFISDIVEGEKRPSRFADDDYRLAAGALLVHTAAIDGEMLPSEREKLHAVLKLHFELDDKTTDELIEKAIAAEQKSVDLYHFTNLLNHVLNEPGRARVVGDRVCRGAARRARGQFAVASRRSARRFHPRTNRTAPADRQ
jgi:uncharacterized tellurite resistance protein B-like protein